MQNSESKFVSNAFGRTTYSNDSLEWIGFEPKRCLSSFDVSFGVLELGMVKWRPDRGFLLFFKEFYDFGGFEIGAL